MPASVLQINTSRGGLPKQPAFFGEVGVEGITTDGHAHPQFHGGPQKALLLITIEGIEELKAQGFPLYAGAMGENITTQGLNRKKMRLGQRYRIGEVIVELSKMRQPCEQLATYGEGIHKAVYDAEVKAGNFATPVWGLGGFYASVIRTGTVRPGDSITLLEEVS